MLLALLLKRQALMNVKTCAACLLWRLDFSDAND
jgi:hypothetical protein